MLKLRSRIRTPVSTIIPYLNSNNNNESRDTLRRHIWQHHKIKEPSSRARQACEGCRATKSRCKGLPCTECVRRVIECVFKDQNQDQDQNPDQTTQSEDKGTTIHPTPLSNKRDQYINLYFEKFHPRWPFIHKGSFDAKRETPLLVQSMVVLGMWASGEESARSAAVDIHHNLDSAVRAQKVRYCYLQSCIVQN
jgi:hypothetical protein